MTNLRRGDVVLADIPFAGWDRSKFRPAVVVLNDQFRDLLTNTVVAQITSNLQSAHAPTRVLIECATPEGRASGLLYDSLVTCENLATIRHDLINTVIGHLPDHVMEQVNQALRVALGLV